MAKYPLSHGTGKPLSEYFKELLTFHVPPPAKVLDPTCGMKHLWSEFPFMLRTLRGPAIFTQYNITFADIRDLGQEVVSDFRDLDYGPVFDAIVFDPPYLYGYFDSPDERESDYGGYSQDFTDLLNLMHSSSSLHEMLKPGGKIVLKCSDMYDTKKRKFMDLHFLWNDMWRGNDLRMVDFNVYPHHHLNPLAFQVKDRPTSVVMHTYFMWYQKGVD